MLKKLLTIILLIIVVIVLYMHVVRRRGMFRVSFTLSGGFMGLYKRIEVDGDKLIYTVGNTSHVFRLRDENIMFLRSFIESRLKYICGEYRPAGGADFFKYSLSVEIDGRNYTVSWVDEWALNKSLPREIIRIEMMFKNLIDIYDVKSSYNRIICVEKNGLILEIYVKKMYGKIFLAGIVENLGEDIKYISPTPCHPDILIKIDGEKIFYPGYTDTPCIQILEQRILRKGEQKITIAFWTPREKGTYEITASFPFHGEKLIEVKGKISSD